MQRCRYLLHGCSSSPNSFISLSKGSIHLSRRFAISSSSVFTFNVSRRLKFIRSSIFAFFRISFRSSEIFLVGASFRVILIYTHFLDRLEANARSSFSSYTRSKRFFRLCRKNLTIRWLPPDVPSQRSYRNPADNDTTNHTMPSVVNLFIAIRFRYS